MQTIPLYQTTGISGFRITRIRTVARSGKATEIKGQDECAKAVRREDRLDFVMARQYAEKVLQRGA